MNTNNYILGSNLSLAWAKALMRCAEATGAVLSPAIVEFPALSDVEIENGEMRPILDTYLRSLEKVEKSVETVAGTIFPASMWKVASEDKNKFFEIYKRCLPRIRRCRDNSHGVYSERLMAYKGNDGKIVNQLEKVIDTWNGGNHRHSAHQIGIYNPTLDHSDSKRRGFPCLQQISLHANGVNGKEGLTITGFYANQNLIEKGYGNYLGLYRLGKFMAKEMGLKLKNVICIATALKLNNETNKKKGEPLVNEISKFIGQATI